MAVRGKEMQPGQMAYDRGTTTFSPDGRLFQVEYAREAVKKGSTTLGIKFKTGVILIADKRVSSRLIEPASLQKVFRVDETVGCATSGLVADARALVDKAREECLNHKVTYGENIGVEMLTKHLCDHEQKFTQLGYGRPFGTAMLIAGTDDLGIHLFETDPSGAMTAYKADCIGLGRPVVMDLLEKEYKDGMELDDAVSLGVKALEAAVEEPLKRESVEICIIDAKFRILSDGEKTKFLSGSKKTETKKAPAKTAKKASSKKE